MLRPLLFSTLTSLFLTQSTLFGAINVIPDLNKELAHNTALIKEYKSAIKELEARNKFLIAEKEKNPKLYEIKPLYEETKDAYINRVKLNGAEAKNINFTIQDHMVTLEMQMKTERKDKNGYYSSSQYFFQSYPVPANVQEEKITHSVDGDYFVITMPKK